MAQPTPYIPNYDFTDWQTAHPSDPLPADQIDLQFNAISTSIGEICDNLALIQRDDGALANNSVGIDQLKAEVDFGFNTLADWVTAHDYVVRDGVYANGARVYRCIVAHTSDTFLTDLAAGKWVLVANFQQYLDTAAASAATATAQAVISTTQAGISTTQATLAGDWASKTNGQVIATEFSAKAWAIGGTNVTGTAARGASKEWATLTSGAVDTVDFSSKAWAIGGTGVTGATNNGSAKDWAISGSSPDGSANLSAKTYATQAAASATATNYRFCGTATGTANALTLTPGTALATYTGALLEFIIASANTTEAMTVNASTIGNKSLKINSNGTSRDPAIGMFQPGMHVIGQYDGTNVVVLNAPWDNQASDVAAAATVALASATGNFANLTGTGGPVTAITGLSKGRRMLLRHTGAHVLTNSGTLVLLGGANITTVAGDFSEWITDGTNVYMTRYHRASGQALALPSTLTSATPAYGDVSTSVVTTDWIARNSFGGFINKFRNPGFEVTQRGTTGTVPAANTLMTADGWYIGAIGAAATWQVSANGSGPGFSRLAITGNTSMSDTLIKQKIESYIASRMAGYSNSFPQAVCFQMQITNVTGATITPTLTVKYANAQDNWGANTVVVNAVNLQPITNNNTVNCSYNFLMPAQACNGVEVTVDFGAALNANTKSVVINYADIRVLADDMNLATVVVAGLNSNPPPFENRPYSVELAYCQRYLQAFTLGGGVDYPTGYTGQCNTTTTAYITVPPIVTPRVPFTGITASATTHFSLTQAALTRTATTNLTFNSGILTGSVLVATVGSAVLVAGNATQLWTSNASASILFTGAEL